MLHVVTGPLYSDLEDAIVEHLQAFRLQHSLKPLTIVVPSEYARLRLQWVLCTEQNLSLFNVHILTFFQLALRIIEEQGQLISHAIRSDNFFREWIHHLMRRKKKRVARLSGINGNSRRVGDSMEYNQRSEKWGRRCEVCSRDTSTKFLDHGSCLSIRLCPL